MAQILLGSIFGLERAAISTACEGDRSASVKQEAWHGDRILHDLVSERVSPSERSHYEANSMLSWFLREGSDLSTYASMHGHSDHSFGTVFEALLYRAPESRRRVVVERYMSWINKRWQNHPVRGRRPRLQSVGHDRAISEHGSSAAEGAAWLAELEAWDGAEGQLSEAELREVLSEMHTGFIATRLGDVQEELALRAAIAASAAEAEAASAAGVEESIEYVGLPTVRPPPPGTAADAARARELREQLVAAQRERKQALALVKLARKQSTRNRRVAWEHAQQACGVGRRAK